jgi:hypothetical protein
LVEKGPLANLLGDTEGPAHEDWDKSAERPDRVWKTWKNRVEFARKIVDSLVEYLTPQQTEPDFDLLSDFFSIEEPQGRQRHRQVGRGETDSGAFPKVNATPKWYQITARTGGFTVSRDMAKPLPENPCLTVSAAYDLSSGNPLKRWNSLDFDFRHEDKRLTKRLKGATIRLEQGNILTLKINSESFSLSIDGFDRNRDLLVRVDDLSDQEPEPEAG